MLLKEKTVRITLCGLITSLSIVTMFLTSLIPSMTYSFCAIAGGILIVVVIEINRKWAWSCFVCASIVSALIVPDKETPLFFIMFFGYYPIIKESIETIKNKKFQLLIKLTLFNLVCFLIFFVVTKLIMLPTEVFSVFGIPSETILLILANITFLLYDRALSILIYKYIVKIHPKIKKFTYF